MPKHQIYKVKKPPGPFGEMWLHYSHDTPSLIGLGFLVIMLFLAIFGPILTPYDASFVTGEYLVAPSWQDEGTPKYLLGTDELGRDIYTRLIYGLQIGLFSAILITFCSFVIGVSLGASAALLPQALKYTILRLSDIIVSIPSLLAAILIIATIGKGLTQVYLALLVVYVPLFIKTTFQSIKEEETKEYVLAAKANGANRSRLFFRSLLPNVAVPLIVQTSYSLANIMLDLAALGFLGMGAQAPTPEWGTMIYEAKDLLFTSPWQILIPGLALGISLFTIHMIGSGIRKALNHQVDI
jgi:ABC-type antimicrobial peptide transport system permease subunit